MTVRKVIVGAALVLVAFPSVLLATAAVATRLLDKTTRRLAGATSNGVDATSEMWAFFREHALESR